METIKTLRSESDYYSRRVERLTVVDNQSNEIGELVETILNSEKGQEELNLKCFLKLKMSTKDICENDSTEWTQFKHDQEANC